MTYRIYLSRRARRDVDEIHEWIAHHSPNGADRWYESFREAMFSLETNAENKGLAPEDMEFERRVRQILFKTRKGHTYRALFVVEGTQVQVVTVRGLGQPLLSANQISRSLDE